jgi:hypothetical protein
VPDTFIKIASVTVGSGGAANILFSSIPNTYTDLCVKFSLRSNYASVYDHMALFLNGDTANNYVTRWIYGDGASAASGNQTATNSVQPRFAVSAANATSNTFGNGEMYLPNYASSNYKSQSWDTVAENNATTGYNAMDAGLWSNTAAVTSVQLNPYFGSWVQYSTATLYGIKSS